MNHHRPSRTLRKRNLERRSVRPSRGKQGIGEQVRNIEREWMNAEEIDEWRDRIGAKWPVRYLLAARPHNDRVQLVVLANSVDDKPRPVNRHGICRLAIHNPKWRLFRPI